jgi:uncharacterized protein
VSGLWLVPTRLALTALPGLAAFLFAACGPQQDSSDQARRPGFSSLGISQVQAGGEIGRRIDLALRKNFLALDLDEDFLRPFRNPQPVEKLEKLDRFTGLGLLIDAAVLFAKSSNDTTVIARKDRLVAETIKTQTLEGWIGAFTEEPDGAHLWREWAFHDASYIVYGLASESRYFGNEASLEAARKLADYLMKRWPSRPRDSSFTTLGTAEAFFALYELTGENRYLRFAADEPMGKKYKIFPAALTSWEEELHPRQRRPPGEVAASQSLNTSPPFDAIHMYRLFERAIMQLRLNRIESRDNLLVMSRRIVEGMTRATKPAMLVSGATSRAEGWHEDQEGRGPVGENCATVYELWFLDELLRWDGDLRYGDIMERAVYNTFFGSQDPRGRRIRYFTPFSGKREYFQLDDFCCPNNFRRGMASLPKLIYYRSGNGVAVNLFSTSHAEFELDDGTSLHVSQTTDFPTSGRVEIALSPARTAEFALRIRIPRWCEKATVAINGGSAEVLKPGAPYFEIVREWRPGDRITFDMPMTWRLIKGRELQEGRAALLRGPIIYGLDPSQNPAVEGFELRDLIIDPDSLLGPLPDSSVRLKAWSPNGDVTSPPTLDLILTEFLSPGCEEIYFRLPDLTRAVDDELIDSIAGLHRPEGKEAKQPERTSSACGGERRMTDQC